MIDTQASVSGGHTNSPAERVLANLTEHPWYEIGKGSALTYLKRRKWLYRRVESIEFVGRRSLRRRMSIDFEGPELPDLGDRGPADGRLVPLSVFVKWPPLMGFDLRGPRDEPLSLNKRSTNKQLDFGLLMGMIETLGIEPARALRERLALLVATNTPPDVHVAEVIDQLQRDLLQAEPEVDEDERNDYIADTANLASQLANSSILWAPLSIQKGCNYIVKFSYLDKHAAFERRKLRQLLISCSWQDRVLYIPLPHAGQHTRYHVDVRRPKAGVEFLRVQTRAFPAMPPGFTVGAPHADSNSELEPETQDSVEDLPGSAPFAQIVDRRAHVYHPPRSAPSHRAYMVLVIAATQEGFISHCAMVSVALAGLVTVGYAELTAAAQNLPAFVVLLAAIPLVLGYVLVRSEDALEREGIIGVRTLAVLSGVIPIVGGLSLVFTADLASDGDLKVARPLWAGLTLASWLIVGGLVWSACMAVSPRDVPRRFRVRNIVATSGILSAVALIASNVILTEPFSGAAQRHPGRYVSHHQALVIVAGALMLTSAGTLHGFLDGVRRLARAKPIETYEHDKEAERPLRDRIAAALLIGMGELWIAAIGAAALLTLWQALTVKSAADHSDAISYANHIINGALAPCAVVMITATFWLAWRSRRSHREEKAPVDHIRASRDYRRLLYMGLLVGMGAIVLRAASVLVPSVGIVPARLAWFGFAGWIILVVAAILWRSRGRSAASYI